MQGGELAALASLSLPSFYVIYLPGDAGDGHPGRGEGRERGKRKAESDRAGVSSLRSHNSDRRRQQLRDHFPVVGRNCDRISPVMEAEAATGPT